MSIRIPILEAAIFVMGERRKNMIILNILCGLLLLIGGGFLGAWIHGILLMYLHDEKPEDFYEYMNKYFYSKEEHDNITSIHRGDRKDLK